MYAGIFISFMLRPGVLIIFIITNQRERRECLGSHALSDCSREAFTHLSCTPPLSSCTAIMSNQSFGVAKDGSRPKSACPNTPSWLPTSAVAKPPPPPPPVTTESQQAEQVSVPTHPCASITCTVGQMSTRVDFANIQDFDRFGMQILQQAHLASMCMATPPTAPPVNLQMMQSQFSSATSLMPAPNMSMMNLSSNQLMLPASGSMQPVVQSSSALQVATGVRPYVPRPVSNPMLQHWPPATDNSLPKEGWFLVNDLWVPLPPNYQYDITELQQSSNCSLMQGCFEVPWKQNPTIFVLLEFQHLLIYDSEGPLQILDNTEIKDPASSKSAKFDFQQTECSYVAVSHDCNEICLQNEIDF